jgi:hypothetical protein
MTPTTGPRRWRSGAVGRRSGRRTATARSWC